MSDRIRVCIPGMFTHAHRDDERKRELKETLAQYDVDAVPEYTPDCQLLFFGDHSVFNYQLLKLHEDRVCPVIHYVWDLYECNVHGPNWRPWSHYLYYLKHSDVVLAPSACTIRKLEAFTERSGYVVKSPVRIWEPPPGNPPQHLAGKIVDVMRWYPDPNSDIVARACAELRLPYLASKTSLAWNEFRWAIRYARLLVSPYWEASTGGLSLLEGYWHGVPNLLSNSPVNGVVDYFGDKGNYFQWDNYEDFKTKLRNLYHWPTPTLPERERKQWIVDEYSEETFVRNIAHHMRETLCQWTSTSATSFSPFNG